jgi:hypothetical protein
MVSGAGVGLLPDEAVAAHHKPGEKFTGCIIGLDRRYHEQHHKG